MIHKPFISHVPAPMAIAMWIFFKHFLEPPMREAQGEFTMAHLREYVETGAMMLLIIVINGRAKGVCAIEHVTYPAKRTLRIVLLGGDGMDEWLDALVGYLDKQALDWRVQDIEIAGRPGWAKLLAEHGYTKTYTVLHKQIKVES